MRRTRRVCAGWAICCTLVWPAVAGAQIQEGRTVQPRHAAPSLYRPPSSAIPTPSRAPDHRVLDTTEHGYNGAAFPQRAPTGGHPAYEGGGPSSAGIGSHGSEAISRHPWRF